MFGSGLSCTFFLRVLFSPALVLHFCLVFLDLILRFCLCGFVSILLPPSSLSIKNTPSLTFSSYETATSTLGGAPSPRALKDQVKKLSSTSTALGPSSTTTAVKKSGPKAAAAAGKKGAAKGKKRGRQDDDDDDEEDDSSKASKDDEGEKESPAKKIKKEIIEYEDGNDDEDAEA